MKGSEMETLINTEIIRDKRIEKGLPQRKIGAMLDVDQSKISDIENGKRRLHFDEAVKLAQFLGINI
jgi:transcriptional regulator with XRE-family HTH domain